MKFSSRSVQLLEIEYLEIHGFSNSCVHFYLIFRSPLNQTRVLDYWLANVWLCVSDGGLAQHRRTAKSSSISSSTSASQVVDFDCPEEFGYYPHPADCTQYFVCVFGGALLESCTGGLMYR